MSLFLFFSSSRIGQTDYSSHFVIIIFHSFVYLDYFSVLESYDYRLPDIEVNVTARNVAVLPCAAASRSSPPAVSQFEFNGARLRMTGL